jgi:hypothetical protein
MQEFLGTTEVEEGRIILIIKTTIIVMIKIYSNPSRQCYNNILRRRQSFVAVTKLIGEIIHIVMQ